jgi:hypothetical protein
MADMERSEEIETMPKMASVGIDWASLSLRSPDEFENRAEPTLDGKVRIVLGWRSWAAVFITCFA